MWWFWAPQTRDNLPRTWFPRLTESPWPASLPGGLPVGHPGCPVPGAAFRTPSPGIRPASHPGCCPGPVIRAVAAPSGARSPAPGSAGRWRAATSDFRGPAGCHLTCRRTGRPRARGVVGAAAAARIAHAAALQRACTDPGDQVLHDWIHPRQMGLRLGQASAQASPHTWTMTRRVLGRRRCSNR